MEIDERNDNGRFLKGNCANPLGRPKGYSIKQRFFNEFVNPYAGELIKKSIEMALEGNEAMLSLLVNRLLPNLKSNNLKIDVSIDTMKDINSIADANHRIIDCTADGEVTLDDANSFSSLLKFQAENLAIIELKQQLDDLQAKFENQNKNVMKQLEYSNE